jgi:peroxiredoxin
MTLAPRTRILPLLFALLFTSAHAETEDRAAMVRKGLRVDTYKSVSYFDENNKEITSEQFDERVRAGVNVSLEKKKSWFGGTSAKLALSTKPMAPPRAYKVKPGEAFPEFSHPTLDNKAMDNKALLGRYTLLSFYFAECAPCIDEVPELNALSAARADMNFVGITFDSPKDTRKFIADHKLSWTLVPDANATIKAAGVTQFPTMALLDPQGKVVAIEPGGSIKSKDKTLAAWLDRVAPKTAN